ncbi:hypothetical protein SS50377_21067 [Spironucleus salmonicida]|uniref:Uncharacterized protein n=1 Tax=Spironucleus salmonicida TaxID=348837 RepID=V6LSI2_9EUKA|nr:hypothetical protein SS50377_21067 [Spironucleus salmonicida]|eukprot:EST43724.1 Hypothetical protein SS50377_16778 [Spironucleus salmonicida]
MKTFRPNSNLSHKRPPSVLSRPPNISKPVHYPKQSSIIIPQPLLPLYTLDTPTQLQKLIKDVEELTGLVDLQIKLLDFDEFQEVLQSCSKLRYITDQKENLINQMNHNMAYRTLELDVVERSLNQLDENLSKIDPSDESINYITTLFDEMKDENLNFNPYKILIFQLQQSLAKVYSEMYFEILNLEINVKSKRFIETMTALMVNKKFFQEKDTTTTKNGVIKEFFEQNVWVKLLPAKNFSHLKVVKQFESLGTDFSVFGAAFYEAIGTNLPDQYRIPLLLQKNQLPLWVYYFEQLVPKDLYDKLISVLSASSSKKQRYLIKKQGEIQLVFDVLSSNLLECQQRINIYKQDMKKQNQPDNQSLVNRLLKLKIQLEQQGSALALELQSIFKTIQSIDITQLTNQQLQDIKVAQILKNQDMVGQPIKQVWLDDQILEIILLEQAATMHLLSYSNTNVITSLEPFLDQINDKILQLVVELEQFSVQQRYEAHRTLLRNYSQTLQQQHTLEIQAKKKQVHSCPTTLKDLQNAQIKKRESQQCFKSFNNQKKLTQKQESLKKEIQKVGRQTVKESSFYE